MGNKDFIKAILERQGKVHFGRVRLRPHPLHLWRQLEQERNQLWVFYYCSSGPSILILL